MNREEAIEYLHRLYMKAEITDEYGDMDNTEPYETAIDMAIGSLRFAQWVAEMIFATGSNSAFSEIACRKLAKIGIIKADGDEWVLEGEDYE